VPPSFSAEKVTTSPADDCGVNVCAMAGELDSPSY
jgi:hypothetical protein